MSAPRSGSTFIGQIFRLIFSSVNGIHNYDENYNVIVFRNFLDSAISHYRVLNDMSKDFVIEDEGVLTKILDDYKIHAQSIVKYVDDPKNRLFFVYSFDIKNGEGNNYDKIFSKIESHYGITINSELREKIMNETNMVINRKRSGKLNTFHMWDSETMIHGNHVANGGINIWKSHVDKSLHQQCENSSLVIDYGYCVKKLGYGDIS
jgi:hypothetical protein